MVYSGKNEYDAMVEFCKKRRLHELADQVLLIYADGCTCCTCIHIEWSRDCT